MGSEPSLARLAATVILARDGRSGLEVFLVRRHERSHALPSAYVFPGGTVRDDDRGLLPPVPAPLIEDLRRRCDSQLDPGTAAALFRCAVRELFEEAGVLLARGARPGPENAAGGIELEEARRLLQQGKASLAEMLERLAREATFEELVPFSHWITPEDLPQRWDAWFFVAAMPDAQQALHCAVETTDGVWIAPREALEGGAGSSLSVVYPTEMHLRRIAEVGSVAKLLAYARTKSIRQVQPGWAEEGARRVPNLPEELVGIW